MDRQWLRILVVALLAASLPLIAAAPVPQPPTQTPLIANINATLQPGEWEGWSLRPSSADGGYIVEVTPRGKPVDGNYVAKALVQAEFDGESWNDVLRVQLPEGMQAQRVNLRVYDTALLPVAAEFEAALEPGVWHGWGLGSTWDDRAYLAEITPLEPSVDGAHIARTVVQPEFDGESWSDVLRVMIPDWMPDLNVYIRVYEVTQLPVVMDFETELAPGEWQGYLVQSSRQQGGHVIEVTPLDPSTDGACVEQALVQPEYDGQHWNDVLRLIIPAGQPALRVHVRVYQTGSRPEKQPIASYPMGKNSAGTEP